MFSFTIITVHSGHDPVIILSFPYPVGITQPGSNNYAEILNVNAICAITVANGHVWSQWPVVAIWRRPPISKLSPTIAHIGPPNHEFVPQSYAAHHIFLQMLAMQHTLLYSKALPSLLWSVVACAAIFCVVSVDWQSGNRAIFCQEEIFDNRIHSSAHCIAFLFQLDYNYWCNQNVLDLNMTQSLEG